MVNLAGRTTKIEAIKMKFLGLAICLGTIIGAAATVGIHLYFDILSLLFVLGGAIGFLVMKNDAENHITNFGNGAVYFGWLGTLVGLIAITGDRFMVWGDVDKMGPALAVSMLTILYGYSLKLITIALAKD
jgi:flagellar motor component MotA